MEGDKTSRREEEDKILLLSVAACHRQQSHLCPVVMNQMGTGQHGSGSGCCVGDARLIHTVSIYEDRHNIHLVFFMS